MKSPEEILLLHSRKYPRMQCRDAVKLLYQNEFGGGHLIADEESCLRYLRREYAATPQNSHGALYEPIGNGMVRVHLRALDDHGISPETLGSWFIRSAALHKGDMARFQQKLQILTELTHQGKLPFSPSELEAWLTAYRASGCPMVSHSEIYRECYRPAYRIVCRQFLPESEP